MTVQKELNMKNQALDAAMLQIEKQFGKGSIMRLGDDHIKTQIPAISTGSLELDIALGVGGVPRGRVIEIYGPESSGKTTLAIHAIAEAQKTGGIAAFVDAEHAPLDVPVRRQQVVVAVGQARDLQIGSWRGLGGLFAFVKDLVGFLRRTGSRRGNGRVVPEESLDRVVAVLGDPALRVGGCKVGVAESGEKFVGEVGGLAYALIVDEAEAAVKWSEARAVLFKDVGEGPIGHRLGKTRRFTQLFEDEGRGDVLVVDGICRSVCRAPLGVMKLKFGRGGGVNQLAGVADALDHGVG